MIWSGEKFLVAASISLMEIIWSEGWNDELSSTDVRPGFGTLVGVGWFGTRFSTLHIFSTTAEMIVAAIMTTATHARMASTVGSMEMKFIIFLLLLFLTIKGLYRFHVERLLGVFVYGVVLESYKGVHEISG
ncbi:hypothetical protein PanWU01x14_207680 [Parasponia andersonii]|uniref:Uncharacterized protein n=1 Tax=Parasponia andersonii TaxID=3476 RepID=A0A2P5BV42_PARAD|nr:hypothetical protein PanWU01x14_207680 [Parasponia andersonii]